MSARVRRSFDGLAIALFAVALIAPAVDSIARPGARADIAVERRVPNSLPERPRDLAQLQLYPRRFEAWWSDAVGLRDVLLRLKSRVSILGFGVSPSASAVIGRERWVFPTQLGMLDISRGETVLSRSRLENWQSVLESRRDFCEAHGASYLIAFAPEKSTIYPDRLPAGWEPRAPTAYDQIVDWMRAHSSVQLLDLRPVLRAERARDRDGDFAYYPLGTHWTDRGMFAAYAAIADALSARHPNLRVRAPSSLHWQDDPLEGDTWASSLRMEGLLHQRSRIIGEIEWGYDCELARDSADETHVSVLGADEHAPRIVLYHDSFGDRMRKLIALSSSRAYFAWQGALDPERVELERPDVVIELYAERKIVVDRPVPLIQAGIDPLRARFEAARQVLFTLDARAAKAQLAALGAGSVRASERELRIAQESGADWFELAPFTFADGAGCILSLELETPASTFVDVMFRTRHAPRYGRAQVASARAAAGASRVHVEIDAADLDGPLRLRFSRERTRVNLRALQVRALAR